ncbi:hypothetical protein [Algoriphagus confluentis]|uniref:Yip1 domain-containing protein n=1 Tax=Algoriphagus confluentis TaxID=1697556 RepID=A0ABQ6PX13_9BACT|nr:hypothetical protein Aconfl_43640 [Algoriphagus confluentis]
MLRKVINCLPCALIAFILIYLFLNYQKSILKDVDFLNFATSRDYIFLDFLLLFISLLISVGSIFFVTLVIYLGFYMANFSINLKIIFVLNLVSNFIFFIPMVFDLVSKKTNLKVDLSLQALFFDDNTSTSLDYLLISVNLFELLYILLFSFLISKVSQSDFDNNLKVVLLSYGGIFLLWIIFILFISLK